MNLTPTEEDLDTAIRALDPELQREIGQLYGANGWDFSLLETADDRQKLRKWVSAKIKQLSPTPGLLNVRRALLYLRRESGDMKEGE
jgi:hypothetical protein